MASPTRNVAIVIWNGAEVLDWAGPAEVFEASADLGKSGEPRPFEVYTVSRTTAPIRSQRFVEVVPNHSIDDAPAPQIVVFPGGGVEAVLEQPAFLAWSGEAARGAEVALSVCTGAFILGAHGLLDGKPVTTWYGATERLARRHPEAIVQPGRRFVDNGDVVTTAGVSAGIDGALHVVARLCGFALALKTAEYMEYGWTPEPYLAKDYRLATDSPDPTP